MRSPERQPHVLLYVPGGGFQLESWLVLQHLDGFSVTLVLPSDSVTSPWMQGYPLFRVSPIITRANRAAWSVLRKLWRNIRHTWSMLRQVRPTIVVCVGSSICLPGFVLARVLGIPTVYIESITRTDTISQTGLLVERLRLASRFYVQWPEQVDGRPRRHYSGTIL